MSKIELARKAYQIERDQGRQANTTFKQYFNFMWKNEKKERLLTYLAYIQK